MNEVPLGSASAKDIAQLKSCIEAGKKKLGTVSKEKDKRVKELKEQQAKEQKEQQELQKKLAVIKSMSVDEIKKLKPATEFEVAPTDDSFTAITITKYKGTDPAVVIPAVLQGLPVKQIGANAFNGNKNLIAVVIPESVKNVSGFNNCENLSVAVIPAGVTTVAGFSGCKNLSTVVLPSTLVGINDNAFYGCSSLKSINLPEGLMYIGEHAFERSGLTSVSLPKSLRLIDYKSFIDCNSLAEIQIPANHAISYDDSYSNEKPFDTFFSGTKIRERIDLQKLLRYTTTRAISQDEYNNLWTEINKKRW